MRWIGWLLLLLTLAGWAACEIRLSEAPGAGQATADDWRRSRDGWERAIWLRSRVETRSPALHPGLVGLLQLLLSLSALVAFPCLSGQARRAEIRPGGSPSGGPSSRRILQPVGR